MGRNIHKPSCFQQDGFDVAGIVDTIVGTLNLQIEVLCSFVSNFGERVCEKFANQMETSASQRWYHQEIDEAIQIVSRPMQ